MNRRKRQEIFERLRAANPHPTTELEYANPFQLLVAVVLSAQSTDGQARRHIQAAQERYPGFEKLSVNRFFI